MFSFLNGFATSGMGMSNGGILALILTSLLGILLMVGLYIYMSFAFYAIAKKNKQNSPGIAWIPGIGPLIISYKGSKMHWWPWLLFIGLVIPVANAIAMVIFAVFSVIWTWKLFEAVNKPGWWAIFSVIPILDVVYFVFVGIVAWSKN